MISNISFTSAYRLSYSNNTRAGVDSFKKFCENTKQDKNVCVLRYNVNDIPHILLNVPEKMDENVETYCAFHNIKYDKLSELSGAKLPISEKKSDIKVAVIDYDKLYKIAENQQSNIRTCQYGYTGFFKDIVKNRFEKEGILSPTYLNIKSAYLPEEQVLNQIKKSGAENIKDDILIVDFVQKQRLDDCTAFMLNELGMKKIPFCMDESTYKLADALGIVCRN